MYFENNLKLITSYSINNFLKIKSNTMSKNEKKTWVTEDEAAAIIELPAKFFRKLVLAGALKGVVNYLNSRRYSYRYNKADIENYMFEDSFLAGL